MSEIEPNDGTGRSLMIVMLAAGAMLCVAAIIAAIFFVWNAMENAANRDEHGRRHEPHSAPSVCLYNSN